MTRSRLLALSMSVLLVGCATLGARLDGVSGPIAWQATDLRIVDRKVTGTDRELYTFVLVLKETQGAAITFTRMAYTISQSDVIITKGDSQQQTIDWRLRPYGELRQPFYFYWYCTDFDCDTAQINSAPWYDIILTGANEQGRPVRVAIDLILPPNPPGPKIVRAEDLPTTSPPAAAMAGVEAPRAIPIQVINNAILVNAVLNRKEYVTLLLDTGVSRTILTPEVAKRLRIMPASDAPKEMTMVLGGQQVEVAYTQLDALSVGDTTIENMQVGVALVMPEAPLVDGVLGEDFLSQFAVRLNYANSRLQLTPAKTLSTALAQVSDPPVRFEIIGGHIAVRARLNHQEDVILVLDTGSTRTLLHPHVAEKFGVSPPSNAPQGATTVFGGRQIAFPLAQLSALTVGDATVEDLQVGVLLAMPWAPGMGGLLGGDFLHHFTVTLDHAGSQLWLEPVE